MNVAQLRLLLGNTKYDHIALDVHVSPSEVEEGCYMCMFKSNDRHQQCLFTEQSCVDGKGNFYKECQVV